MVWESDAKPLFLIKTDENHFFIKNEKPRFSERNNKHRVSEVTRNYVTKNHNFTKATKSTVSCKKENLMKITNAKKNHGFLK